MQGGTPLLDPGGARLTRLGPADFTLQVSRPGDYVVRTHYTPYWSVRDGDACRGLTAIDPRGGARARRGVITARLSIGGLLRRDRSC